MLFITGSESFIGKNLIKECKKKKINYFGVDIKARNTKTTKKIDLRNKFLYKYIPKKSIIIHLAGISKHSDAIKNPSKCFDININGTVNLINCAKLRKVETFIFASSEWIYGEQKDKKKLYENQNIILSELNSIYAISKVISENHLKKLNIFKNLIILRFGILYGGKKKENWSAIESIFQSCKKNSHIEVGSLRSARRFVHLDDLIEGIIKCVNLKNIHTINLSGNELISVKNIINFSEKILKKKIYMRQLKPNNYSIRNLENKKAKAVLKWSPNINLKSYLKSINF